MEILPIIQASTGPAGAIVVLFCVLIGIYRLSVSYVFPIAKEYVDNQAASMKEILTEHKEDRKVFQDTITTLAKRQTRLENDVEDIKTDIKIIKERL
jgi:hypothetical protein